jgi:hypothetical protein
MAVVGTRNARLVRRTLVASIVSISGLAVAAPVAAADPCPPLDLGCVVDDTTTTVGGVVDDTTTTVGGVVDDTTTTVGGVVGGAGQIDPGTVLNGSDPGGTLPGVLPGTGETSPNGGGTTPPGGGTTPPGGGTTPTNGGGTAHTGAASSGSQDPPLVIVAAGGAGSVVPDVSGETSTAVGHPFPTFLDGGGGVLLAATRLVRTLAVPLALIMLTIGFLFVQNRIDRKDPKLALAPVGSDYLTFS